LAAGSPTSWGTHGGFFVVDVRLLVHSLLFAAAVTALLFLLRPPSVPLRHRLLIAPSVFLAVALMVWLVLALAFHRPPLVLESLFPLK
jgi:hypothetical protein